MLIQTDASLSVKQLRSEPRMKVLLSAQLRLPHGAADCRVLDLSRGGACIETDRAPPLGASVELRRGALVAAGTVRWARGRRFGICFAEPIRATDLFVQMSASRNAQPAPAPAPLMVAALPATR